MSSCHIVWKSASAYHYCFCSCCWVSLNLCNLVLKTMWIFIPPSLISLTHSLHTFIMSTLINLLLHVNSIFQCLLKELLHVLTSVDVSHCLLASNKDQQPKDQGGSTTYYSKIRSGTTSFNMATETTYRKDLGQHLLSLFVAQLYYYYILYRTSYVLLIFKGIISLFSFYLKSSWQTV